MTIDEARKKIIGEINSIYDSREAINIAELVIEHITRMPRSEQITNKDLSLSLSQTDLLSKISSRLQQNEPIQYIIHESWFAGMQFYVDNNVLIPRPETEELVEWVVKDAGDGQADANKIIDICTGSGCIAIAIKKKLPQTEVWASDISDDALTIARMNADGLQAAIDFVPADFLDEQQRKQLPQIDIVVCNPPYVPLKDKDPMKKNVVDHEPHLALFVADENPLIFYDALADFGKTNLNPGGRIYAEIHEEAAEQLKKLFELKGYSAEIRKDMQGKDRMIRAVILH